MQSVTAWQRLMWTKAFALGQPVSQDHLPDRSRAVDAEMQLAFPAEDGTSGHA